MAERTGLEPATPGVTGRYSNQLNYRSALVRHLSLNLKPGDVLLSHGEAPHYHRRYFVSLLSSEWKSGGSKALWSPSKILIINGADTQNRTGDLILTKDALYRLSHISTLFVSVRTKKARFYKRALLTFVFAF